MDSNSAIQSGKTHSGQNLEGIEVKTNDGANRASSASKQTPTSDTNVIQFSFTSAKPQPTSIPRSIELRTMDAPTCTKTFTMLANDAKTLDEGMDLVDHLNDLPEEKWGTGLRQIVNNPIFDDKNREKLLQAAAERSIDKAKTIQTRHETEILKIADECKATPPALKNIEEYRKIWNNTLTSIYNLFNQAASNPLYESKARESIMAKVDEFLFNPGQSHSALFEMLLCRLATPMSKMASCPNGIHSLLSKSEAHSQSNNKRFVLTDVQRANVHVACALNVVNIADCEKRAEILYDILDFAKNLGDPHAKLFVLGTLLEQTHLLQADRQNEYRASINEAINEATNDIGAQEVINRSSEAYELEQAAAQWNAARSDDEKTDDETFNGLLKSIDTSNFNSPQKANALAQMVPKLLGKLVNDMGTVSNMAPEGTRDMVQGMGEAASNKAGELYDYTAGAAIKFSAQLFDKIPVIGGLVTGSVSYIGQAAGKQAADLANYAVNTLAETFRGAGLVKGEPLAKFMDVVKKLNIEDQARLLHEMSVGLKKELGKPFKENARNLSPQAEALRAKAMQVMATEAEDLQRKVDVASKNMCATQAAWKATNQSVFDTTVTEEKKKHDSAVDKYGEAIAAVKKHDAAMKDAAKLPATLQAEAYSTLTKMVKVVDTINSIVPSLPEQHKERVKEGLAEFLNDLPDGAAQKMLVDKVVTAFTPRLDEAVAGSIEAVREGVGQTYDDAKDVWSKFTQGVRNTQAASADGKVKTTSEFLYTAVTEQAPTLMSGMKAIGNFLDRSGIGSWIGMPKGSDPNKLQ